MRLQLTFLPSGPATLELHSPGQPARSLPKTEIQSLADEPLPEKLPAMLDLGRRLYRFLDGPERRLATLAPNSTLDLHFVTEPGRPSVLAHLPWELLHDENSFLVQRGIPPVRRISFGSQTRDTERPQPANRPLNVLFMTCSPRNVRPVLDFESEERIILDGTRQQHLYLTPEETGSVEELGETVLSYDPFDVFHLTGHGDLYDDARHQSYLAPHQHFPAGRPVFFTEDERGDCRLADAEAIERAFENRMPGLVFLSGCRTGELPQAEQAEASLAHSSLAQDLLYRGFPSVLGWARPVLDRAATEAARLLYRELAAGSSIETSLRQALREMARPGSDGEPFQIPDWHLLRLFTTDECATAALVTPKSTPGRRPFETPRFDEGFLDPNTKEIKVAGFRSFVGRRRPLQRTLPALQPGSGYTGVAIWGMGGLGKSSLAARLCDRVERRSRQFRRAVLDGILDERRLLALLQAKYADHDAALVLDSRLPLRGRLQRFFTAIDEDHPLLLVLDDFEQNISLDSKSSEGFLLSRPASDTLTSLCTAIRESRSQTRVIVTSRYWSARLFEDTGLHAEQLPQMDESELRKKARRELPVTDSEAAGKLIASAAGNPRLFETLLKHKDGQDNEEEFRVWLKLASVVETLSDDERMQLARLSVFRIPVSPSMAQEVAGDAEFHRAVSLGLVQRVEPRTGETDSCLAVADLVRVLVESALDDEQWRACYSNAARAAHWSWWVEKKDPGELSSVEIVRLATLGGEREIACDVAKRLARFWNNRARYRDTVQWARFVLSRFEDHRLLGSVAVAERSLGDPVSAAAHLDRALALTPVEDAQGRSFSLREMAILRAQQGDTAGAMNLYRQSLDITEETGDVQGKAATLHEMATLRAQQGDVTGAMELYRQSLDIWEQIGYVQGKSATLHAVANLKADQGDIAGAMDFYRQSLDLKEQISDVQGKAATLHQMAVLMAQQGDIAGSMDFYHQSLGMKEQIGDVRGKAVTLSDLAVLAHKARDAAGALAYSEQASQALVTVRAWPDLSIVLTNLSVCDPDRRLFWAKQAAWLVLALGNFSPGPFSKVANLFNALPSGDPLELPLAAISFLFTGPDAQAEAMREQAANLLAIAAENSSLSPEAAFAWVQKALEDPAHLIRETLQAIETLDPAPWIFDRQLVLAAPAPDIRSSKEVSA